MRYVVLVVFFILMLLAHPISADTLVVDALVFSDHPGTFDLDLPDVKDGETVDWSWSATGSLDFRIEDPHGNLIVAVQQQVSSGGQFTASTTGTYHFYFTNYGLEAVTVTYNISSIPLSETIIDLATGIIAVIIIIGMVIFLLFALMGKKPSFLTPKKSTRIPPPTQLTPQCPRCRSISAWNQSVERYQCPLCGTLF